MREAPEITLRQMGDALTDVVWISDLEMKTIYCNRAWLEFTGEPLKDQLGASWTDFLHPEDLNATQQIFSQAFDLRQPFESECRIRRHDGAWRWMLNRGRPWRKDGEFHGYVGSAIDITGRHIAESTLRVQREVLERVASNAPLEESLTRLCTMIELILPDTVCSVMILDPTTHSLSLHVAPSIPAELIPLLEKIPVSETAGSCSAAAFTGSPVIVEDTETSSNWSDAREIARKLGIRSCWSHPVCFEEGKVEGTFAISSGAPRRPERYEHELLAVGSQLGGLAVEQFKREEKLRRRGEHLRQSQKMEALGQLAGGIAHDFNNLLTAIIGNVELALEDLPGESTLRSRLEQTEQSAEQAANLTRQLLTFSRRRPAKKSALDPEVVIRSVTSVVERLIPEDIQLEVRCAAELWPVRADTADLEQIVLNLVINARDAMTTGGTLTIGLDNLETDNVDAGDLEPGRYVQLEVIDSGSGIDPSTLSRVFEPFFTTKKAGQGTGLGLSTVYSIVQGIQGSIAAESEPGKGTRFVVRVPATERADSQEKETEKTAPAAHSAHERLLVCEDDPLVRGIATEILSKAGYDVSVAANGQEALRSFEDSGGFDLLVTDMIMPGMSGKQLSVLLRERNPGLRVLFVSGYASDVLADLGGLEPTDTVLHKPFQRAALLEAVQNVLEAATK